MNYHQKGEETIKYYEILLRRASSLLENLFIYESINHIINLIKMTN